MTETEINEEEKMGGAGGGGVGVGGESNTKIQRNSLTRSTAEASECTIFPRSSTNFQWLD